MSSLFEVNAVLDRLPAQFTTHQFVLTYQDLYPGHYTGLVKSQGHSRQLAQALKAVHAMMGRHLDRHCRNAVRPFANKRRAYPFLAAPANDAFSLWQRLT
ncbi:hypothetical protein [Pseudomonas sp. RIT-PI-AD]|uniref:hypothetical protein n=1 Tax=Pseudomonas sp. RIT-PI-AD TaxID=3035294 RepID=UPI0021DADE39|nr:hypothetical protein [Pseudomonas sp. RIT-PI-AD]